MRMMLTANLSVQDRMANGTQGRLLQWQPDRDADDKKALLASHPELQARFLRETALKKSFLADIDFIDVTTRSEIEFRAGGASHAC